MIQGEGIRSAMKPPTNTLAPSTTAKAPRAPAKTRKGLCFMDRVMTAMWVLSQNSKREKRVKEAMRGVISISL